MKKEEAYLTVHLALCLTVILALYLTLIEGARRSGAGMEAACVADIGLQSVMAEYHRELLRQYNLFAVDISYGTDICAKANAEAHLRKYLTKNLSLKDVPWAVSSYRDFFGLEVEDVEMTAASILTDGKGAVFRQRAVEAVQDDMWLSALDQIQEWMDVVEVNGLDTEDTWGDDVPLEEQISEFAEGEGLKVNPLSRLEEKKRLGILRLTVEEEKNISQCTIHMDDLVMERMKRGETNQGNMGDTQSDTLDQVIERFFFQEYLLRYMENFVGKDNGQDGKGRENLDSAESTEKTGNTERAENGKKLEMVKDPEGAEKALQYQIEYLIAGKENDTDNLRSVANRLCAMREAANLIHLYADAEKRMEVEVLATIVCTALLVPILIPVLEVALMLGWAYAESIYDVKSLLAGGKIPLLKDKENWHYSLQSALSGQLGDKASGGQGLSYQDYLRILLTLTGLDTLTGRAMNMVEADMRMTAGNQLFRLDGCYDKVCFEISMSSHFGYQYQLNREKSYD